MLEAHSNGSYQEGGTKDLKENSVVRASAIAKVSDHEIRIDTNSGSSYIIDMNKEKEFINAFTTGDVTVEHFVENIFAQPELGQTLLNNGILAKQLKGGRLSLWDGHLARIESEFSQQLKHPTFAYKAHVLEANNGGYIVDIQGIRCFMPGSLAAAGIIEDFSSLVGKDIPVMIENYVNNLGFVVSYKKYLNTILPHKIETELFIGQAIKGKVTGACEYGVFIQFPDADGEWVFSGLVHTSTMSKDFAKKFNARKFNNGDMLDLYINNIMIKGNKQRVILSDFNPLDAVKTALDTSIAK